MTQLYRCARCGLLTDAAGTRLTLAQAAALPAGWHDATLTDGECCGERVADDLAREFWAGVDERVGPDGGEGGWTISEVRRLDHGVLNTGPAKRSQNSR